MNPEIIATLVGALFSLLAGASIGSEIIQKLIRKFLKRPEPPVKSYTERLADLTDNLTTASEQVDAILAELSGVARDRESAVQKLETDLRTLAAREKHLKERIETLEKTPIPVAEHFARLLEKGERRSAKRDYALFGAGVVVTTIIAVIIQLFTK